MGKTLFLIRLLAIASILFNATLIDFQDPLEGNSLIALIGICASLCAVLLMAIHTTSRKIKDKMDDR